MNIYRIEHFDVLDSTNKYLIERAENDHEAEGLVVIAGSQTSGRGRKGRSFFSPSGSGCYMSLLLRPELPLPSAALITPLAALAVCRAIEGCTGLAPGIKWVNDIVLPEKQIRPGVLSASGEGGWSEKRISADIAKAAGSEAQPLPSYGGKVCGILTESAASPDMKLSWLVLGIGINLCPPENGFPEDLKTAAALFDRVPGPETGTIIAERVLKEFRPLYEGLEKDPENRNFLEEYKRRSAVLGREITVHRPGSPVLSAKAIDIDNDCRLIVRYDNGKVEALNSGEISIRPAP